MATGRFGKETYKSEQGVRAHMRGCTQYRKSKKLPALGCILQAGSTPSDQPPTSIEPDCVAPLREFEKTMHEFSTTQEAPQTPAAIASVNPPGGEGTGRRSVSLIVWDCDVDEAWRRENGERAAVCCLSVDQRIAWHASGDTDQRGWPHVRSWAGAEARIVE